MDMPISKFQPTIKVLEGLVGEVTQADLAHVPENKLKSVAQALSDRFAAVANKLDDDIAAGKLVLPVDAHGNTAKPIEDAVGGGLFAGAMFDVDAQPLTHHGVVDFFGGATKMIQDGINLLKSF